MAYTLSKYEKETVILYNQSNDRVILFPIKNAPNPLPTSNTDDCIF